MYKLLINKNGLWEEIDKSFDESKLTRKGVEELGDNVEWMVVSVIRHSSGKH
ncbi:hypothetical protein [Bacteroides sp.]|uniref:hypothetical protein n=1 Tax=Bacteroides sp. TaxID=29523 RepID=UPI0026075F26|nr:hypothetical protein [Bacteroides sp.]MDD3041010.1 hypothetical protein [Bacteroides sp.]